LHSRRRLRRMLACVLNLPAPHSTDVPSTGPSVSPSGKSVHWTVRSLRSPLDRPVFQVLSRRLDLRRFRVVARTNRRRFHPSLRVRRAPFKKEPITVVSRTDETVTFEVKQSWKGKDSISRKARPKSRPIGWIATPMWRKVWQFVNMRLCQRMWCHLHG
jgi:hypothetical protein